MPPVEEEFRNDPHLWEPKFHLVNPVCHRAAPGAGLSGRVLLVDLHRMSPRFMHGVYPFTRTHNRYPYRLVLCLPAGRFCNSHVACIQLLSLLGFRGMYIGGMCRLIGRDFGMKYIRMTKKMITVEKTWNAAHTHPEHSHHNHLRTRRRHGFCLALSTVLE